MAISTRSRGAASVVVVVACTGLLAACAQSSKSAGGAGSSKEYFAESVWGVKASPRVSYGKSSLPRGGGRDQIGRPYMVRGKMYYPKEDKNYSKVGYASWYGDAFHGRLTANGEVYDQTHLTAAHPTMPLPSYARVTNVANGRSVIVRVNDRGPYANNRLIDLSRSAAEMLDYARMGTAKVKVEYVGRAPLEGRDDSFLLASYRPGNAAPAAVDGLPAGVMVAMNGPTPSASAAASRVAAFPGMLTNAAGKRMTRSAQTLTAESIQISLPARGPIAPERPAVTTVKGTRLVLAALSYASESPTGTNAFDVLEGKSVGAGEGNSDGAGVSPASEPFVAAGTFTDRSEAERVRDLLAGFGRTDLGASMADGAEVYSVDVYPDGRNSLNGLLEAAWQNGAPDAIAVRD